MHSTSRMPTFFSARVCSLLFFLFFLSLQLPLQSRKKPTVTFPYRPNRILISTTLCVLSTLCSVTSGLSKVLVVSVDPVKALPSPAKASSSNFFWSRFVLGFGFHPTGDHCLETSFLFSLQQSPFSMAVSQRPLLYPSAAKNHRRTLCNSPPSSRQRKIDFTCLHSPQGS